MLPCAEVAGEFMLYGSTIWICTAFLVTGSISEARGQAPDPPRLHTQSGEDLGTLNFHEIAEADSGVRFTSPGDVKVRKAQTFSDRQVESVVLRNNASLVLTKTMYRKTFGPASYDPAPYWLKSVAEEKFLRDQGFAFDENKVGRAGRIAYEVQSSTTATCFVYTAFLGDGIELTRELHGWVCYRIGDRSAEELEREMLGLLARARFAKSSDKSDFSVTLEIPAARLS